MKIREIMTRGVETVRPDTLLEEAANKMKELNIGALPVFDGKALMGMVTDRDIVVRSVSKGDDPRKTPVSDVMSSEMLTCVEDDELEDIAEQMKMKKVRRIPVISPEGGLAGMVSLGDLAERGERDVACETLEKISTPSRPKK